MATTDVREELLRSISDALAAGGGTLVPPSTEAALEPKTESGQAFAANETRTEAIVQNIGTTDLGVKLGDPAPASMADCNKLIAPASDVGVGDGETAFFTRFQGPIHVFFADDDDAGNSANCTEMSA